MAVVVIGFRGRENLRAAVESIRTQGETEVIVVNSGGGEPERQLAGLLEGVTLIDVTEPQLVGAARNIGIDASRSPDVAFLAGDCLALPGWVEGRLRMHRRGVRAVGSAMAPAVDLGAVGLVAYLMLFASRAARPQISALPTYGLSLTRSVFDEVGYFSTATRVGEDSDFVRRLAGRVPALTNPAVQTVHASPRGWLSFLAEMRVRGERAARYQAAVREARRQRAGYIAALRRLWGERVALARAGAASVPGLDEPGLRRLLPGIRLAAGAYVAGVDRGLRRLERSRTVLARAQSGDRTAAQEAVQCDAESIAARLQLFGLLHGIGEVAAAKIELETAMRLAAFDAGRQMRLRDWLLARGFEAEAATFAGIARICAPPGPVPAPEGEGP